MYHLVSFFAQLHTRYGTLTLRVLLVKIYTYWHPIYTPGYVGRRPGVSGYARGGQPVSGPVARPHASQFWPVAWRHCGTESSNYCTQSCQSVLELLQHNWNNPYNYLLLLPVGLRTWSWKANTADTMGLLWNIQRHWSQNLRVTTFRCAGRGYQRGDRVSTPKLERSSTWRYTPPPTNHKAALSESSLGSSSLGFPANHLP